MNLVNKNYYWVGGKLMIHSWRKILRECYLADVFKCNIVRSMLWIDPFEIMLMRKWWGWEHGMYVLVSMLGLGVLNSYNYLEFSIRKIWLSILNINIKTSMDNIRTLPWYFYCTILHILWMSTFHFFIGS